MVLQSMLFMVNGQQWHFNKQDHSLQQYLQISNSFLRYIIVKEIKTSL